MPTRDVWQKNFPVEALLSQGAFQSAGCLPRLGVQGCVTTRGVTGRGRPSFSITNTMSNFNGWIGVDLDGTLAEYSSWKGSGHIGEPVPRMLARVRAWIGEGRNVRIFTARVSPEACALNGDLREKVVKVIQDWCLVHLGVSLPVTHEKDMAMVQLWDDRCVQVISNTGLRADGEL